MPPKTGAVAKKVLPPKGWEVLYKGIQKIRSVTPAPVDTIGCNKLYDVDATRDVQRYHILISLLLSSQTRDEVNAAAMERLRGQTFVTDKKFKPPMTVHSLVGCTPATISKMTEDQVKSLIYGVGFYNNKAKYIKAVTERIVNEFKGVVPSDYDILVSMPGLGPKMIHLFMQCADGVVTGIGVDTHVHRISRRLNWTPPTATTPEATRKALEAWLPRDKWAEINELLVGLGQTICRPVNPQCERCSVSNICPSAFKESGAKKSPSKAATTPVVDIEAIAVLGSKRPRK
jgi:endonuclease-3